MLKGFKNFLMRGNVVNLAVAVVIGTAFTAVVTAFTSSIIKPVIALAGGGSVQGFGFRLNPSNPDTYLNFATAINSVITFFITAAVVYFLFVVPMKKLQERRKTGEEKSDPTEAELLLEIRDLLRSEQGLPKIEGLASAVSASASTANSTTEASSQAKASNQAKARSESKTTSESKATSEPKATESTKATSFTSGSNGTAST